MSYSSEVLADSPLIYVRLGDAAGSTTVIDSSGGAHHGAVVGSTTGMFGVAGALVGDSDTAANFGAIQYITFDYGTFMDAAAVTVEAWIKTTATGSREIWDRDTSPSKRVWQFGLVAGGAIRFVTIGGTVGVVVGQSTVAVNDGVWHHVVATFDGSNIRIYIDGVLNKTQPAPGALATPAAAPMAIGINNYASGSPVSPLVGVLDEAAYYGTALSAARIAAHYAAGTTAPAPTHSITLAAVAPAATAAFSLSRTLPTRDITLAGTAPAASASFTLEHAEPPPPVNEVTFLATAPAATATLDLAHFAPIDLTFAATAPAATAAFLLDTPDGEPRITFAAVAPAATAAFTLLGPLTTTTDLTSDVSEGYNYDGESDVLDDGTTGSIPAGIRLAPIRIVHQSLPAPVLVKGRPV